MAAGWLLGPATARLYLVNVGVSAYGTFVLVAAANFTWVGWRLVKGAPDPYRGFPAVVWIGALVFGATMAAIGPLLPASS